MGYLQQVGAHQRARSTNCLPELTVCRARLVGADTGGQAPEAKGGVEVTEASPAAGGGALCHCTHEKSNFRGRAAVKVLLRWVF